MAFRLIALVLLLQAALAALPCSAAELRLGINRVNLAWLPAAEERRVVDAMAGSGVRAVRLSLSRPVAESLAIVREARARGLEVLLEIPLSNPDFYPQGTPARSGHGRIWDMPRLSDLDLGRFGAIVTAVLDDLDRSGTRLLAVEPGNEINWAPYNGDLAILPSAPAQTAASANRLVEAPRFREGLARYLGALRVVRQSLSRSHVNRDARLVAAGLSDVPRSLADRRGMERVSIAETLDLLRQGGLDDIVDAYGIHVYPNRALPPDQRREAIEAELATCGSRKPCWITEWGLPQADTACPLDDAPRARIVTEVLSLFREKAAAGAVEAAFYFDFDATHPYSVWRCGSLSAAGRAAIGVE